MVAIQYDTPYDNKITWCLIVIIIANHRHCRYNQVDEPNHDTRQLSSFSCMQEFIF